MKIIHSTIGILLIVFGCTLMSITVFNEEVKTVVYKIWGAFIVVAGTFYLKKIAKFGKQ